VTAGIATRAQFLKQALGNSDRVEARTQALLLAVQTIALAAACWQAKMTPYAAWLALPAIAQLIANLPALAGGTPAITRLGAFLLLNESTLGAVGGMALALTSRPAAAPDPLARTSCSETRTVSTLAALPPGLVLAPIDLGPYIAALTPHRVVMAPYHRIDRSIVMGHALLDATPGAAETRLRRMGVAYVVACATATPTTAAPARSLQQAVESGAGAAFLAPHPLPPGTGLNVFRVTGTK